MGATESDSNLLLEEEARRCERISLGITNAALTRQLLEWAAEYRARSTMTRAGNSQTLTQNGRRTFVRAD